MNPNADVNDRRIDVWGQVLRLWRHKWVWLAVFAVIAAAGFAYAFTRPAQSEAVQRVRLSLPAAATEGEATQQAAVLGPLALSYVDFATLPPFTDAFVAKHPDLADPGLLKESVTVEMRNVLLLDFRATGSDAERQATLARDLASSFVDAIAAGAAGDPGTVLNAQLLDEPITSAASSNKTLLLATSLLAAAAVATVAALVAAGLAERSQRRQLRE